MSEHVFQPLRREQPLSPIEQTLGVRAPDPLAGLRIKSPEFPLKQP
jgi:hypothetical protein